jgi:hypothetical protein
VRARVIALTRPRQRARVDARRARVERERAHRRARGAVTSDAAEIDATSSHVDDEPPERHPDGDDAGGD